MVCDSLGVGAADLRDDVALDQHAVSGRPDQHLGGERGVRRSYEWARLRAARAMMMWKRAAEKMTVVAVTNDDNDHDGKMITITLRTIMS